MGNYLPQETEKLNGIASLADDLKVIPFQNNSL